MSASIAKVIKPPIDLSTLTSAQNDALIVELLELVHTLTQQIQEVQALLELNSCNSSRLSPSSDGYGQPKLKSTRAKSGEWLSRSSWADAEEDRSPGSYA